MTGGAIAAHAAAAPKARRAGVIKLAPFRRARRRSFQIEWHSEYRALFFCCHEIRL
jgi:hypothetical protein